MQKRKKKKEVWLLGTVALKIKHKWVKGYILSKEKKSSNLINKYFCGLPANLENPSWTVMV